MDMISAVRPSNDVEASRSRPPGSRDPDAPDLDRIDSDHTHLDLMWSPHPGDKVRVGAETFRQTWVLLRGAPIAPPPLLSDDKGKGPLRPLWGVGDFKWQRLRGNVFRLLIMQPNRKWLGFFVNIGEPHNRDGWCPSYRTYSDALAWDETLQRMRTADADRLEMPARLRTFSPPRVRLAPALHIGPQPLARAASPVPRGGSPVASQNVAGIAPMGAPEPENASPLAWNAPQDVQPPPRPASPPRAPVLMSYSAAEAARQVKRLFRTMGPRAQLAWVCYEGHNLVAVVLVPRVDWSRFFSDTSRDFDLRVYHASLHHTWDAPYKARVRGGGGFPPDMPSRPGESTTVESYGDTYIGGEWILDLAVDDNGATLVRINDKPATLALQVR